MRCGFAKCSCSPKCSGDRPVCKRCTTRGLICTYSCREPRSRGPVRPRQRVAPAIELPSVFESIYRGIAMQPYSIRQHYRTASLPQQQQQQKQGTLQARIHPTKTDSLLTDVPVLTGSPARQHMSHDFGQVRVQSKRLEPLMLSAVQPMARHAGQIQPLGHTAGKAEGPVNFCVPLGGAFAMPCDAPATPVANALTLKVPESAGLMGSVAFRLDKTPRS